MSVFLIVCKSVIALTPASQLNACRTINTGRQATAELDNLVFLLSLLLELSSQWIHYLSKHHGCALILNNICSEFHGCSKNAFVYLKVVDNMFRSWLSLLFLREVG